MTWTDRMKLVWTTFKREALVMYVMYIILIVAFVVIFFAVGIGVSVGIMSAYPNILDGSFSERMPIPGMPSSSMMDPSLSGMFSSFGGSTSDISALIPFIGPLIGIFFLVFVITIIVGSAFQAGEINLTFKAYREKVSFKDFKFAGFLRNLGWIIVITMISIIIFIIGVIGTIAFSQHTVGLVIFLILYGLLAIGLFFYCLPWLTSSLFYLLAHREEGFFAAFKGSFRFFKRHMGALWGLVGTILLTQVPYVVLSRFSDGLATIYSLAISPYISVLAIVWVLTLEDEDRNYNEAKLVPPIVTSSITYPEKQVISITKPDYSSQTVDIPDSIDPKIEVPIAYSDTPKIGLEKMEPSIIFPKDDPNFCPSCGKANTGTAYCPQCGTKL